MKLSIDTKASFSIGKTINSGLHFAAKEKAKPCSWSHVEQESRTGKLSNLTLQAK